MMLLKLSDEKILHFTTHILNLQSSIKIQNSEISLRTFGENESHLAITIQDFSFSISLRGGGAQTGSLTHLKHRGHNTTRRVRVTECCEDRALCPDCGGCDHWLTPPASPLSSHQLSPGQRTETGLGVSGIGGERGTTLVRILLCFANFSLLSIKF